MAIDKPNVVDGIGLADNNQTLIMLLTDHLLWLPNGTDSVLSEHDHLMLLQEKLNAYISFYADSQYKSSYPDANINKAVIDIRFKYDISENCKRFLQSVQNQVEQWGLKITITANFG